MECPQAVQHVGSFLRYTLGSLSPFLALAPYLLRVVINLDVLYFGNFTEIVNYTGAAAVAMFSAPNYPILMAGRVTYGLGVSKPTLPAAAVDVPQCKHGCLFLRSMLEGQWLQNIFLTSDNDFNARSCLLQIGFAMHAAPAYIAEVVSVMTTAHTWSECVIAPGG
jgi:hypothetical protein